MKRMIFNKKNSGFTLVEVIFVCGIIGLSLNYAIPSFISLTENIKTEVLTEELFTDLNSTKISAISIGQKYSFTFLDDGWEIKTNGNVVKKKKMLQDNLVIKKDFEELNFNTFGFTSDKNGNTITLEKIEVCNTVTNNNYIIEINAFGKTKIKEGLCTIIITE